MIRRLKLVVLVIIFATSVRHAAAQDFGFRGRDFEKTLARGYTNEQLVAEKKLLAVIKSQATPWENLPLIKFPRRYLLPDSLRARLREDKFRELQQSKIGAAQ